MIPSPISPARLDFNGEGIPYAPDFGDLYHPAAGAFVQARHVFLGGNGLPGRWQGQHRFVILETGFGLGNNFLATWAAWRADPARCERLVFISLEKHPLSVTDLRRVHRDSTEPALARALIDQWPLATPDVHSLDFDGGRVQLMLVFGDAAQTLGGLQAEVDAIYLDGFAPSRNSVMWTPDLFKRLARLSRPGTTVATWSAARAVRDGLAAQGFVVELAAGFGDKREITVANYAPRFLPPRPAAFRTTHHGSREALVIGAGLAGCAAAWALARQGWHSTVLDRQPAPACETSGNPGGLMHGIFNAPDSLHSRWFRAASLLTARLARDALASGQVQGDLGGCLRLESRLDESRVLQQLASVGLPEDYVRWMNADEAARFSGLPVGQGGWFYRQAGWLSPADWARWLLRQAVDGGLARFQGHTAVARLARIDSAEGGWQALDAEGRLIATAPVVVLANAGLAAQLMPPTAPVPSLSGIRGQTTVLPAGMLGMRAPAHALAGTGYALRLGDDRVLIGATSQPDDSGVSLREEDHRHNLTRAAALGVVPEEAGGALPEGLDGRVGWRATTPDRLPLVGPPVDVAAMARAAQTRTRLDGLRLKPRWHDDREGLYLLAGLGARGITSAALSAQVLAAWVTGSPFPVDSSLRDAIDPGRQSGG